jgi:hypothetical protein
MARGRADRKEIAQGRGQGTGNSEGPEQETMEERSDQRAGRWYRGMKAGECILMQQGKMQKNATEGSLS